MLKKYFVLLICFISCMMSFCLPVNAEEDSNWIRLVGTVPEDFNLEVFVSVKNQETGAIYPTTIRTSSEYIGYVTVEPGVYVLESVSVASEYESYFDIGFSTQPIRVTGDVTEPVSVSYYIGLASESNSNETSNKDTSNEEYDDSYEDEALSEEEYIASLKEQQEQETAEKEFLEQKKQDNKEWFVSFGVTCFMLVGLAVVYWYLKKKRDSFDK